MFRRLRDAGAMRRKVEEALYEAVSKEIAAGIRKEGLWTKSLSETEGDEAKARALYIRHRVQAMKDDISLYESFKRDLEKSLQQSTRSDQVQNVAKQKAAQKEAKWKWRCFRCEGPVRVNYGSADVLICKECAKKSA